MEQLIIRLGSRQHDPVHWLVWSTDEAEIIASGELPDADQLTTLSERAGRRAVIALVPTSDVLMKQVTLPPKAGHKVLAAIPFMVEDELAADITTQFFAYGPKHNDQQAVAIVDHDKMQQWKAMLSAAGLHCDRMLPDILAVPENTEGWSTLTLGNDWLVRQNHWQGMQGEAEWLLPIIEHHAKRQEAPLIIHNYSDQPINHLAHVDTTTADLEPAMQVLAKTALATKFNLLQGEYKSRKQGNAVWRQWRVAAVLAILVFGSTLVDNFVQLQQLSSKNDAMAAQITDTVKQGFPNIGAYRDVKAKLKAEMQKLESGGNGASMTVMLVQLSEAFARSQIKPQTIRFDGKRTEIRLQAEGNNFEALETFKKGAESAGFTVEQGAINNRDDKVIGTMIIRSPS